MAFGQAGKEIEKCLEHDNLRLNEKAFTRKRRLGAKRLLMLILQGIYKALQLTLDDYYERMNEETISKQAFSKARQNLNPEYVRRFFDITAEVAAKDDTLDAYIGMRLIAIDGSDIALENSEDLKKRFGCSGPKKNAATALASTAYGPLDHVIYDCRIDRYEKDERDLARLHVERLLELGLRGSLLLFDRWYPSAEFISFLNDKGFHFIMRAREKWNLKADVIKTQGWISVVFKERVIPVRVLKVGLPTGETETLLTSLNQKQLPIRKAGTLYFKRWGVETSYDLLKNKLQLENFSGKTETSVKQDFYATMYLANMTAFIAGEADEQIKTTDMEKSLKYPRQANRNRSISKLRKNFLRLLLEPDPLLRKVMLSRLRNSIAARPVPIIPNRSPPRKLPRKKSFFIAKKSVV
jgi:hypothetical protein